MAAQRITPRTLLKLAERAFPSLSVVAIFCLLAAGRLRAVDQLGGLELGALAALVASLAMTGLRRFRRVRAGSTQRIDDDLELGAELLATAFPLVALVGAPVYPVVYLLMAFLVAFFPRSAGGTLLGVALLFDATITLGPGAPRFSEFASHATFLVLFAALYHVVLSARIALARKAESEAVHNRIREAEERARTFRLVSSGSNDSLSGMKEQEKWLLASVKEIEGAVGASLEIAELALRTHTVGAFLLTTDERALTLYDCRSASERVEREKFVAGEGILGGVLKRNVPVRMHAPGGLKGVTYYEAGGPTVKSLLAVPIVEAGGLMRGVLIADRLEDAEFSANDERLLQTVANEVLRAIEVERVMNYIRKTRDEKDRFYRAIEELNRAGSPDQVFLAVLESARQLAGLDFAAVTLVSEVEGKRIHKVARMLGVTSAGKAMEGKTFPDNTGLVANVVRYGAPLPGRELRQMDKQVIFDEETQVRGLAGLKILPLTAGDRILGTLVAGSRKKAALDDEVLRMLEVLAIQAAQAVLRAQLYEQMEKMATTDGLTGLVNHRTFQSRAEEALAQAKRYGRKCSLILTDIDHFKSVNDTYGHPTGDMVLRGVAKILRDKARDTDIVARYGGEEFAIVMPETDVKGAYAIAERIREAVQAEIFQTEMGPLKVTLSLGIATFPDSHTEKQGLIDLSDQCLYHAKRHGRNQSVTVAQMQGGRRMHAVE